MPIPCRAARRRVPSAGAGADGVRRGRDATVRAARGDRAAAARRATHRCGCCTSATSTSRPASDRKQDWVREPGRRSSPTWSSTPATTSPTATPCPSCSTSSAALLDVPGVFVFGSNDYFARRCATRCATCCPTPAAATRTSAAAAVRRPARRPDAAGWLDLTNRRDSLTVGDPTFAFAGVDDPHLRVRPARRRRRAGRPDGRRAARRRARAVPAGARPVRRGRLRRGAGRATPTAARSASRAAAR